MGTDDIVPMTEISDEGYLVEIYSDERIREFLAEDGLTPELKKRIKGKLKESKALMSPSKSDRQ